MEFGMEYLQKTECVGPDIAVVDIVVDSYVDLVTTEKDAAPNDSLAGLAIVASLDTSAMQHE